MEETIAGAAAADKENMSEMNACEVKCNENESMPQKEDKQQTDEAVAIAEQITSTVQPEEAQVEQVVEQPPVDQQMSDNTQPTLTIDAPQPVEVQQPNEIVQTAVNDEPQQMQVDIVPTNTEVQQEPAKIENAEQIQEQIPQLAQLNNASLEDKIITHQDQTDQNNQQQHQEQMNSMNVSTSEALASSTLNTNTQMTANSANEANTLLELASLSGQQVIITEGGANLIHEYGHPTSVQQNNLSQNQLMNGHGITSTASAHMNTSMIMNSTVNATMDSTLMVSTSGANGEVDSDEQNSSLKEMEESLGMSPGLSGSGAAGNSFSGNNTSISTHTYRKTEWDVKKLEIHVRSTYNDLMPLEEMSPEKLNGYLLGFFELAKKSDGMDYEPESLIGFMNSFERYLKTKNYPVSLLRSEIFKESRNILKKKRDLVRSIGKLIRTKTKDTCYLLQFHRNLLKEKGLLNRDHPDCLLAEIYLNNMIFFGEHLKEDKAWRGNLNLVWGDMILERDSNSGVEYITLATYAKKQSRATITSSSAQQAAAKSKAARAKNGGSSSPETFVQVADPSAPRIYARPPAIWCPVEAYKNYKSRRPSNCLDRDSPFYLAPLFKSKHNSKIWFKALAMSCQRLDALFYCLFKKAGVDLTSLASMSQQQQQQAVAAAASIINKNESSTQVSVAHNEALINGGLKHSNDLQHHHQQHQLHQQNHHQHQNGSAYYPTAANNHAAAGQQHIITTVPAQVQVQVQVQVAPPQQQHNNGQLLA